jgi:two-component system, cell cycle response regulator DivK
MVPSPSRVSIGMPRILVIEDDEANRLLFFDYLTYAGFTVVAQPNGLGLEQHLEEFQPDLLLLDLGLPHIDGYHLLATLKASTRWQFLPVVVVSGYAFQENQTRAQALGACQYLVKPVRLKELIQAIHGALALESDMAKGLSDYREPSSSLAPQPLQPPPLSSPGQSAKTSERVDLV